MQTDRPTDAPKKNKGKLKQLHIVGREAKHKAELLFWHKGGIVLFLRRSDNKSGGSQGAIPLFYFGANVCSSYSYVGIVQKGPKTIAELLF